jgi:hypothetical protein
MPMPSEGRQRWPRRLLAVSQWSSRRCTTGSRRARPRSWCQNQIFEERVAKRWLEGSGTTFDTEDDLDLDLEHDVDFEL